MNAATDPPKSAGHHVCPPWVGSLLANPIRRIWQDPAKILGPHVRLGMRVLDIGPGMGFFSLPLAKIVGPTGRVICVDLQEKMLAGLMRRARRAALADRIETRLCSPGSLGIADLSGTIDFVLAFAVVHETGNAAAFFAEVGSVVRPGGRVLFAEPKGHVNARDFDESVAAARASDLRSLGTLMIARSRAILLERG